MINITIICFTLFLLTIITGLRKKADLLNPARIFIATWSLSIGLSTLKLSYYQHIWSLHSWILMLIGLLSFLLGIFIVYLRILNQPIPSIKSLKESILLNTINRNKFFISILLLFFLYSTGYIGSVYVIGFIPALHPLPGESRVYFTVFGFGLLVHLAPVILFLILEYIILFRKKYTSKKIILGILFLLTLGSYSLLLQRMAIFMWLVMSIVFIYYVGKRIKFRTILLGFVFLISVFLIISNIRLIKHIENYIYLTSKMKFSEKYAILTEPYMYNVMNLENFSRASVKLENHTYGYFTFNPILAITGLKHWLVDYFNINEKPFLISGYNTYPFHWYYYYDYGILGLFILPLLYGMIVAIIYLKMRLSSKIIYVALYTMITFSIIMSFFFNTFTLLHFVFNFTTLFIVQYFSENRFTIKKNLTV